MNLKGWLFGDFIDKIECNLEDREICWRFPINEKEISYNAKLLVNNYQICVISIDKGIFDTFTHGEYRLNIDTLPNVAKALNWQEDHDEPFIADIYFLDSNSFTFKWATTEPILLHDKDNSIAQVIASGKFTTRISSVSLFLSYIFKDNKIQSINRLFEDNLINALANRSNSIYTLASSEIEFAYFLKSRLVNIFIENGLILEDIAVDKLDVEQKLPSIVGIASENNHYYIIKNSKANGPYSKDKIVEMIKNNKLIPASYIWKHGLESWVRVKDLFDVENL